MEIGLEMEGNEVKKRGRGRPRKRKREDKEKEDLEKKLRTAIKQALEKGWKPLVGRYVLKEFEGSGVFLGKIIYYDSGLYRVDYEDGDCEDLDSGEVREILVADENFNSDLRDRRKQLDDMLKSKSSKSRNSGKKKVEIQNEVENSTLSELTGSNDDVQREGDDDSSGNSCENMQDRDWGSEVEVRVPPPELPPSSGTIGVPEEYVSHLFSIYGFLRSFNICLFLSPFTLDDLVGAVNCRVQNTLLDAIHVALLRAVRHHLETLSSDGSEIASKCLSCIDWSLLDSVTWPVYLLNYFTMMEYAKGPEWKGFHEDLLKRDYFALPVTWKLKILQILCDDALDCARVREEIDIREESEFGIDPDAFAIDVLENGPRRVHPRYSKTSACKGREAMEIIAESHVTKSSSTSKYLGFRDTEKDADISDDRNFDECRLCGMDGTLICCDGCPSAYHGRCIGVLKMYMTEGLWYCPECTINKIGPTIIGGTSISGAEVFGTDSYDQVFLGTCNHLLVLRTSFGGESCLRYYSQKDILKVLRILSSTVQYRLIYLEICKAIADYWHIPHSSFFPIEMTGSLNLELSKEEKFSIPSLPSSLMESHKVPDAVDGDNGISLNRSGVDDKDTSRKIQADSQCHFMNLCNGDITKMENGSVVCGELCVEIKRDSTVSVNKQTGSLDRVNQILVDRSGGVEPATCTSVTSDGSHVGQVDGACLPATKSSQNKKDHHLGFGSDESNSEKDHIYVGIQFRPYAYINNYSHGNFVASAASELAILTSEETRVSEAHKSGSTRKNISDITLQAKAFSAVASRFFWPSSEKKHMEVPRERCGWCHTCKLSSNKRGCMLNAAALAATKSALKILSGLRSTMKGEGSLPSLKTYILYMGEVLCGLTGGPFLSENYRKQWRKQVEDASTCYAVKDSLLDLEKHLRAIVLSGDWFKSMDDWLVESVSIQSASSVTGTAQKRGLGGRRQRKQSSNDVADRGDDKAFVWWRGGKILSSVFHKAILPLSMVKRMARKGYLKKISGVNYGDDLEIPKRSKQLAWRAAVETCKNASHLALQIRCLDNHVRWNDLFHPEQNVLDGKGPETEASVFRNASICDKNVEGNKIMYGVFFGNQKHLPSRVMKSTIKVEQIEDGKDKFWFSETYVPLYLIKEYEESLNKKDLLSNEKSSNALSNLQKRQLKTSRKDFFLYLARRRDGLDNCSCASCQNDVLIRDAVKCSICQGYIHKKCTISSAIYPNAQSLACKKCCAKAAAHAERNESPITPLHLQQIETHNTITATKVKIKPLPPRKMESHNSMTATKVKIKIHNQPILSVGAKETHEETKQANAFSMGVKAKKSCNWGVIWKKKNIDDSGVDFRRRNVLLKGSSERNWLLRPDCYLCKKPYDCDKMYIHCESCNHWYHAEAVELEESKLPDLIGFKCCKCRRIRSPVCPYEDVKEIEQLESLKTRKMACKVDQIDPNSVTAMESVNRDTDASFFHTGEAYVQDDDSLLFSLSEVEHILDQNTAGDIGWNVMGQGLRKLPVRRQTKHELDTEGFSANVIDNYESGLQIDNLRTHDISCDYTAGPDLELNVAQAPKKLPVRRQAKHEGDAEVVSANNLYNAKLGEPLETDNLGTYDVFCAEWGVPSSGSGGDIQFDDINYEDMEFEPQTYFSFTELLESEEGGQLDGCQVSGNQVGSGADSSNAVSHEAGGHVDLMPTQESLTNLIPCKVCLDLDPAPELCCEICGFVIHGTCSPWVESLPAQGNWRCGQCRDWR